jgi:hypothetical protein
LFFLTLAVAVAEFLRSLHSANAKNKTYAERAEKAIGSVITDNKAPIVSPFAEEVEHDFHWGNLRKLNSVQSVWAWRWQVATLLAFAIASSTLISMR